MKRRNLKKFFEKKRGRKKDSRIQKKIIKDYRESIQLALMVKVPHSRIIDITLSLLKAGLSREEIIEMLVGVAVFRWGIKEQVERQVKSIKKTRPDFQGKGPFKGEDVHILAIWALFTPPLEKAIRDYFRKIVEEAFALYCSHKIKAS